MRIWLLLLLVPASAVAQDAIYKCVDAQGAIAYQNAPCPHGSKVADALPYEPLTPMEERQARADRLAREAEAERQRQHDQAVAANRAARARAWRAANPTKFQQQKQRCEDARAARDRARKNAPLWRSVDYLDKLDERVHKECSGIW